MYTVIYHPLVKARDLKSIPAGFHKKIFQTIEKKLMTEPKKFGKPLQVELKGYYRLRVGIYRIIYSIEEEKITVCIIQIGVRKDFIVYKEAAKRLELM